MSAFNRRMLWFGVFIAIVLGALMELFPSLEGVSRVDLLSKSGLGYASHEIPLTDAEVSLYEHTTVSKRWYQFGPHSFALVVVDASRNRHAVHDPLYCFRGSGWLIRSKEVFELEGGKACLLRMTKNSESHETIYWFSTGTSRHASVFRYWLQTTLRRLTLGRSGQEPVMIILQSLGEDSPDWRTIVDQFGPLYDL